MTMTTVKEREIFLIFRIWASKKNCGWRCAHKNEGGGEAICNLSLDKEMETENFVDENIKLKRANDETNRWERTPRCIQAEKDLIVYQEPKQDFDNPGFARHEMSADERDARQKGFTGLWFDQKDDKSNGESKEQPGDKEFFDELIERQFGDDAQFILFKDDFVFIGYCSKPNCLGIFKYAFGRLTEIEPSLWNMLNQMFVWKSIDEKTCHEIAGILIKYTRDEKESIG